MNALNAFIFLASQGVALARHFHNHSPYDIAGYGIALKTAKSYTKLADALFGPTDSPRLQREAVALAETRGLSLEHLLMIDRHARSIKTRGGAWKLRAELIAYEGNFEEVNAYAIQRVKDLTGPTTREHGISFSKPHTDGTRSATITADQRFITDFEKSLDTIIAQTQAAENEQPVAPPMPRKQALLNAFRQRLDRGGTFSPQYRTVITVGLSDTAKIMSGDSDEVIVGLSDGTTMTGAELVDTAISGALGSDIFVGLFHPTEGPVNLYQARFANLKQRILAMAENLVCPWPDCNTPADRSQIHHLYAHKHGGQTHPGNLCVLCPYHNGVNDDDPEKPRRGRMDRKDGKVEYTSPGGRNLKNTHPVSNLGAMDLIGT